MTQMPAGDTPQFDPSAPHMATPRLRPVRGFPLNMQGQDGQQQVMLGLADAKQISQQIVAAAPGFQVVLPKMDGRRGMKQIVAEVGSGLTEEALGRFIAELDRAGLIEGPTFQAMYEQMCADYDSADVLPPGRTAAFADQLVDARLGEDTTDEQRAAQGGATLTGQFDAWMDQVMANVDDPSFDELPGVLLVPHSEYMRAWPNYALGWGRMRVVDRPDRVIVLGANHFGLGKGVVGCDKGFASPIGVCPADEALIGALRGSLGESLFEHRHDHEREHSIEHQIPWIQHCLGADADGSYCPVFGALVHDPTVNNGEAYENDGVGLPAFVEAVRDALSTLGGRTLIVCSAEFSHTGQAFGDQQSLAREAEGADAFREQVITRDRELIGLVEQGKPDELVSSLAWQQNASRWNSTGAIVASMKIARPERIRTLNYLAAADPQGLSLVATAAIAMW